MPPCARRGLAGGGVVRGGAQLLRALPGPVRAAAAASAPLVQPGQLAAAGQVRHKRESPRDSAMLDCYLLCHCYALCKS